MAEWSIYDDEPDPSPYLEELIANGFIERVGFVTGAAIWNTQWVDTKILQDGDTITWTAEWTME